MKKEKKLLPAVIYIDDLEKIFNIFKSVSKDVMIETESVGIIGFEELSGINSEKLSALTIRISEPLMFLEMMPDMVSFYIDKDVKSGREIFENIKKVLYSRRVIVLWLADNLFSGLFAGATAGAGASLIISSPILTERLLMPQAAIKLTGLILLALGAVLAVMAFRFRSFSVIYLKKRYEPKSLFIRNWDMIAIGAFVLVVCFMLFMAIPNFWQFIVWLRGNRSPF